MSELTDFLLARIAEDEGEARVHPDSALKNTGDGSWDGGLYTWVSNGMFGGGMTSARLLAECGAKRRIVDTAEASTQCRTHGESRAAGCDECRACCLIEGYDMGLLGIIASVYADHPDYREEWT